ncbi:hypothetical protein [Mycobacterium tuberculosis]
MGVGNIGFANTGSGNFAPGGPSGGP